LNRVWPEEKLATREAETTDCYKLTGQGSIYQPVFVSSLANVTALDAQITEEGAIVLNQTDNWYKQRQAKDAEKQ